jgi:hypothetical protein
MLVEAGGVPRLHTRRGTIAGIAVIAAIARDRKMKKSMIELSQKDATSTVNRKPEARYAYYRRCQLFRPNGVQCKAPAMKGEPLCYSHMAEADLARRREAQRRAVLEEAARRMRAAGALDFTVGDVFGDFRAIQKVIAVMAEALIRGRIDERTAGRLAGDVQRASRILGNCVLPQRSSERERSQRKATPRSVHSAQAGVPVPHKQKRGQQIQRSFGSPSRSLGPLTMTGLGDIAKLIGPATARLLGAGTRKPPSGTTAKPGGQSGTRRPENERDVG